MPYPAQTDRTAIIAAARASIERGGADALNLADLAAALGIKAPSLYRHVANKPALLQAVVADGYARLFAAYDIARSADDAPLAQIKAVLTTHRQWAHANPQVYMLAFTLPRPVPDNQALEHAVQPIHALMATMVGAEAALGALRGALALVHGFVMLELNAQFQRGGDLDAAFDQVLQAYMRGVASA